MTPSAGAAMHHRRPAPDALALLLAAARDLGVPDNYGREHRLRQVREPARLLPIGKDVHGRDQWLTPRAARAWSKMHAAATRAGVELLVVSAFRSVEYQLGLLCRKRERGQSMAAILQVSAAPGYSEHHSGRAVDLTTPAFAALEIEFERSPAFAWLCDNAASFGFHLSYPRGNPHGIAYEPWHWCWHEKPKAR
jgi:D-alanyl-D-alanine carboxypeptidase